MLRAIVDQLGDDSDDVRSTQPVLRCTDRIFVRSGRRARCRRAEQSPDGVHQDSSGFRPQAQVVYSLSNTDDEIDRSGCPFLRRGERLYLRPGGKELERVANCLPNRLSPRGIFRN